MEPWQPWRPLRSNVLNIPGCPDPRAAGEIYFFFFPLASKILLLSGCDIGPGLDVVCRAKEQGILVDLEEPSVLALFSAPGWSTICYYVV